MITGKKIDIEVLKHQKEYAVCQDRYVALVSGFGAGKTIGMIDRSLALLKRRRQQKKRPTIAIVTPTYGEIRDTVRPKILEHFSENNIKFVEKKKEKKLIVPAFGMGEIWFRSANKPERIVGFDATDMLLDEFDLINTVDQQEEVWNKCIGRLRDCNDFTLGVTTTPEGYKYTHQKFKEEKVGTLMQVKTEANKFLPQEYIDNLRDQYDDLLIEQYLNGKFVNIRGHRAYYAFSRKMSVIDEYKPKTNQIIVGWDFNVDPMCLAIGEYYKPTDTLTFFDEIKIRDANTEKACNVLLDKYPNSYIARTKPQQRTKLYKVSAYPDATGTKRQTSAPKGQTDLKLIKSFGINTYGRRNDFVRDRLNITNNAISKGKVKVTKNCKALIGDWEKNITDEYGNIIKNKQDETHMGEAASYPVSRIFKIKDGSKWQFRGY